jgi:hypothetical protein
MKNIISNMTENISQAVPAHTPLSILHVTNNSISVEEEKDLIVMRGIFQSGNGKDYKGYYYDQLCDEKDECEITLKVSAMNRCKLTSGSVVTIRGFITRQVISPGFIQIQFNATEVFGYTAVGFTGPDVAVFERKQLTSNNGFMDFEEEKKFEGKILWRKKLLADLDRQIASFRNNQISRRKAFFFVIVAMVVGGTLGYILSR